MTTKMARVAPAEQAEMMTATTSTRSESSTHSKERPRGSKDRVTTMRVGAVSDHEGVGIARVGRGIRSTCRQVYEKTGWYDSILALSVRRFIRGKLFGILALVALIIALTFSEIFAIAQVPTNTELDAILMIVFTLFFFEFVGLILTDATYIFSFFFWMDLLGTASLVFDISFLAGPDVTKPVQIRRDAAGGGNLVVVRAARAAKLGARAGRISRLLKLLFFLPFIFGKNRDEGRHRVAKVISTQLTNVLSTRVAFLTICLVVVLPLSWLFTYPEVDDSMDAWTELLATDANDVVLAVSATAQSLAQIQLDEELARFKEFYSHLNYGPFDVQYGDSSSNTFVADSETLDMHLSTSLTAPRRQSSIRLVIFDSVQASFNMATMKQQEAAAAIGLICFIVLVMIAFGLIMSTSITSVALKPLERMMSVVRERCKEIFRYTNDLASDTDEEASEEGEDYDEQEKTSEFNLLERAVGKLTRIAELSSAHKEVEAKENMTEDEVIQVSFVQGTAHTLRKASKRPKDKAPDIISEHSSVQDQVTATSPLVTPRDQTAAISSLAPETLASLQTAHFDAWGVTGKGMRLATAVHIISSCEGAADFYHANVPEATLITFIGAVEPKYRPNPFHSFFHALDVLYEVARYMSLISTESFLADISQFWLMIAALGHDLGHTGVNNQFLVETSHELAVKYNDTSPLENMHCALLFQILGQESTNIFRLVDKPTYKEIRAGMIAAILHTDVTKHNQMIKDLGMLYQINSDKFDGLDPGAVVGESPAQMQLIVNSLLHTADVGNPMKPWDMAKKLAHFCLDEFFAQGDMEKESGLPVQMLNDRDKVNRPNSQIGFIEFMIAPMVKTMVNIFPQLDCLAENLGINVERWSQVWQEEAHPAPDAVAKVNVRVENLVKMCNSFKKRTLSIRSSMASPFR